MENWTLWRRCPAVECSESCYQQEVAQGIRNRLFFNDFYGAVHRALLVFTSVSGWVRTAN